MNRDLTFCFGIVVSENDSPKFLKRSLNSILNQTKLVQQIIILRNGDLNRLLNHCIEDFTKQVDILKHDLIVASTELRVYTTRATSLGNTSIMLI